jgi:hypothetical protein
MQEIQWCEHLKVDPFPIMGYTIAHIASMACVLVVGQGKVRAICERCTPTFLDNLQKVSGHSATHQVN